MKIKIVHSNQTIEPDLPLSYDEITFEKFLELGEVGNDRIKAMPCLTGLDYELLKSAKVVNLDSILPLLSFLDEPLKADVPKKILKYSIPKNLENEETQRYLDLKLCIEESINLDPIEQLKRYPLYCAIYACSDPKAYGKYSYEYAVEMQKEFFKAPCTEVVGIGHFTLLKMLGLKKNTDLSSPQPSTTKRKLKLVLINWRKILVHIQRWFYLRKRRELA